MGITLSKKGRAAIKQQAAWGTAESSFASTDYLEVEAPMVPTLAREALRTDTFRPAFTEPEIVAGSKAPTELTFRFKLHGWSSTTPSSDPTVFPDALLFQCLLGGANGGGYTTAQLGGVAATGTTYTNGQASTGWIGHAQLLPLTSGRTIAWLSDVNTGATPDISTFIEACSGTPQSGTAYGSYVASLAMDEQSPLTLDWRGNSSDNDAQITFYDGLPTSIRLTLAPKQLPQVEVTMRFLNWTNAGPSGDSVADYTYGYPLIPATIGANGSYSALNGTSFCFASATFELTQELSEVECNSSDQGVSKLVPTDKRVTAEITFIDTDLATLGLDSADEPGEAATGSLQVDAASLTPGRSLSILIPAPKLLEQPTLQDLGGKVATRLLYGCTAYSSDTGTTKPADTPFRIAWL